VTETPDDRAARWSAYRAALYPEARKRHGERLTARRQARESQLRAVIGNAIGEALRKQLPTAVAQFTETVTTAPLTESAPDVPAKPLHKMDPEEWRMHAAQYWPQTPARSRRPMTIGELVKGQYEGDGAA